MHTSSAAFYIFFAVLAAFSLAAAPSTAKRDFGPIHRIPVDPSSCSALVVFIHGLGDGDTSTTNSEGDPRAPTNSWLEPLAAMSIARPGMCFVLPTAPRRYVKVAKKETTAWFDVSDARFKDVSAKGVNDDDVAEAAEHIMSVTKTHLRQFALSWKNVVFAGFSQGAAVALYAALTAPETVAGVVAIGGFLPSQDKLLGLGVMRRLQNPPVLFIHGAKDRVVLLQHARHAEKQLKRVGVKKIKFFESPELQHGLDDEGMEVFKQFVDEVAKDDEDEDM